MLRKPGVKGCGKSIVGNGRGKRQKLFSLVFSFFFSTDSHSSSAMIWIDKCYNSTINKSSFRGSKKGRGFSVCAFRFLIALLFDFSHPHKRLIYNMRLLKSAGDNRYAFHTRKCRILILIYISRIYVHHARVSDIETDTRQLRKITGKCSVFFSIMF